MCVFIIFCILQLFKIIHGYVYDYHLSFIVHHSCSSLLGKFLILPFSQFPNSNEDEEDEEANETAVKSSRFRRSISSAWDTVMNYYPSYEEKRLSDVLDKCIADEEYTGQEENTTKVAVVMCPSFLFSVDPRELEQSSLLYEGGDEFCAAIVHRGVHRKHVYCSHGHHAALY
jgi:hypothetical protein